MIVLGVAVTAVVAFLASSAYYAAMAPIEQRALGAGAPDRGEVRPWKVVTELLRTVVVAAAFAWFADRAGLADLPGSLGLAGVLWVTFPVVLLTGSVIWEGVAPVTAAIHAGDWLVKLLLAGVILGLLH